MNLRIELELGMKNARKAGHCDQFARQALALVIILGLQLTAAQSGYAQGAAGAVPPGGSRKVPGITVSPNQKLPSHPVRPDAGQGPTDEAEPRGPGCRYQREGDLQLLV